MSILSWLRPRKPRSEPEAAVIVTVDELKISVRDGEGATHTLELANLCGVIVETNDTGPWGMDCWWLLFGPDDKVAVAFPQGATGERVAVEHLMKLPGFDHETMAAAMTCTDNRVFPVWRASADS